jgi:inward rectifier potassium channel
MKKLQSDLVELEKKREDTGFGTQVVNEGTRLVRSDGNFNVKKIGQSFGARANIFHRLITMPWWKLSIVVFTFYFLTNILFATIYVLVGIEHLQGIDNGTKIQNFWEAFFFSSQTLTTLGYGRIAPVGLGANIVSSIEALVGLLAFSITTGLLYGRFSRPVPMILYSDKAMIAPYLDIQGLMIKMANEKSNQLINVEATLIYSRNELKNGIITRQYYPLELERKYVKYFSLSWTIVHPITEKSPLFDQTPESLHASNSELLLSVDGINDTFSDHINSRRSYLYDEIIFGQKFANIISSQNDQYVLDLSKINSLQEN